MKKSLSITFLVALLFPLFSFAQAYEGIVNNYLKVLEVSGDRVKVEDAAALDTFLPGDKVLLIQMTGMEKAFLSARYRTNLLSAYRQCGKFEIMQVDSVQKIPETVVVFTDNIFNTYDSGEKIQLVRIPESDKIIVSNKITAREWDGSTGGIIALIGSDTIDLRADIDASGSGFRGGQPENFSPVNCREYITDTVNWTEAETGRAGHKGEGIITAPYTFTRGTAEALNGGGSGYGKYSGGGGGSNYTNGGKGGKQYNACNNDIFAEGGFSQLDHNMLFCQPSTRRIIMGGGGGAGTQDASDGRTATPGGDGGGIILLVTETLLGNGGVLRSNGQSVAGVATASGGGGGAGGTILVDAAAYSGSFTVEAKGGNGGNTGTNCTGAGGSGSGGILWHSGLQLFPGATVSTNFSAGTRGLSDAGFCGGTKQWGNQGGPGDKEDSLLLILNGFLFNTIRGNQAICAGQVPALITGSTPKGGNGVYTYNWEQSPDGTSWTPATETPYGKNYQPLALNPTTYYRRIVSSDGIVDNSMNIKIHVYPVIAGNTITGTDTICYNLTAGQLKGTIPPALSGGNESFAYKWLYSANGTTWDTIKQANATFADFDPGTLTSTSHYRRFVQSTPYCSHTSNPVIVTVLPSITSNTFYTPDTTICQSFGPGRLNIRKPEDGDQNDYRFAWWQKSASSVWSLIAGAIDTFYNPGPLDETMWYKRTVFSGNDDACIDTLAVKLVTVLDSISNNLLGIDSSRYCAGDEPAQINGSTPGGGDAGNYVYEWQMDTSGPWTVIDGAIYENYSPEIVETHTDFRRLISSGQLNVAGQYACHSISPVLSLEVIPYIVNHVRLEDQTLCLHNTPLPFDPDTATGGYGNITYQWMAQEEGSSWVSAPGTSTLSGYVPGSLEKTTYFVRDAFSDICMQRSDTILVTVYPVIINNIITGIPAVYTCFNTAETLNGPGYSGGKAGDYSFLWQMSTDNIVWNPATGSTANNLADFETSALTDSLLLRRIIYSSAAIRECSDTSTPVTVRINSLPSGDVVASLDTLCRGESLDIRFNVSGEHGPWKVTVGEGEFTGSADNVTATSGSVTLGFDQDHVIRMLEIRDDSLCYADATAFSNEVTVKVYEIPEADAGPGGEICGLQFALNAAALPSTHKGLWTAPGGTFPGSDNTSPAAVITLDHYGKETITWTVTNWRCTNSDTAGVTFYRQPVLTLSDTMAGVDAGPRQDLDSCRYFTQLEGRLDVGTGRWLVVQGIGIISSDTMRNATVTELDVFNLLRWTVTNGVCPAVKDSVEITIVPIKPPKGFSPNGDLINDVFRIPTDNEKVERIAIKIFSRTGVLVFESDDYTHGDLWGGTGKNNLDLPEGTYFYIMDIYPIGKSEPLPFKSFVEILR